MQHIQCNTILVFSLSFSLCPLLLLYFSLCLNNIQMKLKALFFALIYLHEVDICSVFTVVLYYVSPPQTAGGGDRQMFAAYSCVTKCSCIFPLYSSESEPDCKTYQKHHIFLLFCTGSSPVSHCVHESDNSTSTNSLPMLKRIQLTLEASFPECAWSPSLPLKCAPVSVHLYFCLLIDLFAVL